MNIETWALGKTLYEVRKKQKKNLRIIRNNKTFYPLSNDSDIRRLNVEVDSDIVTKAWLG